MLPHGRHPTRASRFYLNYEAQCLAAPAVGVPRDALTTPGRCSLVFMAHPRNHGSWWAIYSW
ncbi:hypothetical protein E2C01_099865 [Portunus trituberculatus]|uniref:Uncharacterized protein n=1 Tax=Portunus trituberculatus TaxID=210409 RepID=A0A5B7K4X0_PORTR|nr:hypothetical protein [Portunus trituberculatus]